MDTRYAVSYEVTPEMVVPVAAPDEWRLLDSFRQPLAVSADERAPDGYHFIGEETRRVQVEDSKTGERFYVFQHVRFYDSPGPVSLPLAAKG